MMKAKNSFFTTRASKTMCIYLLPTFPIVYISILTIGDIYLLSLQCFSFEKKNLMLTIWDRYSILNWEALIKGHGAALSVCISVGSKSHFLIPESDPSLLPLPLFSSGLQKLPGREAIKTSGQVAIFSSHSLLMKRTWPGNWVQYPPFPHCLSVSHQTPKPEQGVYFLV